MSHPALWPKKRFFYPVGNTPAVSLTQDLPPEESAEVLLLGCGDPRNILYTIHAESSFTQKPSRKIDFTCCDFESAVLARNLLLFSLIADERPNDLVWDIFFHMKLSKRANILLLAQCDKLIGMTVSLQAWSASPYSSFIRFCSIDTMNQLHQRFKQYSSTRNFTKSKTRTSWALFENEFKSRYGETNNVFFSGVRGAGPFFLEAAPIISKNFIHYWTTGTTAEDSKGLWHVNPTFLYSMGGEFRCAVHYGTYPLQCFHLSKSFVDMKKSAKIKLKDLLSTAHSQFGDWCRSFQRSITSNSPLIVRLFAGDALSLCHTLLHYRTTGASDACFYTSQWRGAKLVLDGGDYHQDHPTFAPTSFKTIDSSNLVDHVGLLNVLIVTSPLLDRHPLATLYTETLLTQGLAAQDSGFLGQLCMDVSMAGLLLGIAPKEFMSNFTSISNTQELLMCQTIQSNQYHERIPWRIPELCDMACSTNRPPLATFSSKALATILFDIYYNMFMDEDTAKMFDMRHLAATGLPSSVVHYHRGTFALLLRLVKSRVLVDWQVTMTGIYDLLHTDQRLLMGTNNYQELTTLLYLHGIYDVEIFSDLALRKTSMKEWGVDWTKGIFKHWKEVPPIVCLVLTVPRKHLKILDQEHSQELGMPMLQCEVIGGRSGKAMFSLDGFRNIFSSIQITFGTLTVSGTGQNTCVQINEDPAGCGGQSPLILSAWMSSHSLAREPSNTQVNLSVHSTPVTTTVLLPKLGMELALFKVNITDTKFVHLTRTRPDLISEVEVRRESSPLLSSVDQANKVDIAVNGNAPSMTIRWSLADTSALNGVHLSHEQTSPCTILVSAGSKKKALTYPFPVRHDNIKMRIARASGWVEVVASCVDPIGSPNALSPERLAVMSLPSPGHPVVWNMHRIFLDSLPIRNQNSDATWINPHVSLAFSDRESKLRNSPSHSHPIVDVKDTLHALFNRATESNARHLFAFNDPSNGGVYTIIYVNQLRLDASSQTIVLDGGILPLSKELLSRHGQLISDLTSGGTMVSIVVRKAERQAWKKLLPAYIERCRTWQHKITCEYMMKGSVPLDCSLEWEGNPLCNCGVGLDLGLLAKDKAWSTLTPYMTRIAISPLFAIPWLEKVGGSIKHMHDMFRDLRGPLEASEGDQKSGDGCDTCGRSSGKLLKCSGCHIAKYCGTDCQKAAWRVHKLQCKPSI